MKSVEAGDLCGFAINKSRNVGDDVQRIAVFLFDK